jgi:hypothetical protein
MFCQPRSLARCLAIGLAAGAIAPGAASAVPIIEGQGVAAGGGPGVTANQFRSQNLTAPDQVDRVEPSRVIPQPPRWPTGPQPAATRHAPTTTSPKATPSDDGGLDTGVWIAIAGGSVLALGAAGLAGQRAVVRKRQVA